MNAIKKRFVRVNATLNCLVYAVIMDMSFVNGDPTYESYKNFTGIGKPAEDL